MRAKCRPPQRADRRYVSVRIEGKASGVPVARQPMHAEVGTEFRVMRYLNATDELSTRPQRIIVAGTSGSGKTRLAARIGAALQIPHVEIDALHHGPGWVKRPEFEVDVRRFACSR
jgi:hypothetical protein